MNNDYWLLAPTVATSLIAVAFALLWRHEAQLYKLAGHARDFFKHALAGQYAYVKRLEAQDALTLCYVDGLEEYADLVTLLNADLHDTLIDKANEIKMLHRQTVEIPSTSAKIPARPKRTAKKKVEASE